MVTMFDAVTAVFLGITGDLKTADDGIKALVEHILNPPFLVGTFSEFAEIDEVFIETEKVQAALYQMIHMRGADMGDTAVLGLGQGLPNGDQRVQAAEGKFHGQHRQRILDLDHGQTVGDHEP